jgi:hypothetical protein
MASSNFLQNNRSARTSFCSRPWVSFSWTNFIWRKKNLFPALWGSNFFFGMNGISFRNYLVQIQLIFHMWRIGRLLHGTPMFPHGSFNVFFKKPNFFIILIDLVIWNLTNENWTWAELSNYRCRPTQAILIFHGKIIRWRQFNRIRNAAGLYRSICQNSQRERGRKSFNMQLTVIDARYYHLIDSFIQWVSEWWLVDWCIQWVSEWWLVDWCIQ